MFVLEGFLVPFYKLLFLELAAKRNLRQFILAGFSGTMLHILLDSPLYIDIQPLFPLKLNPFYNPSITREIYLLCMVMGALGLVFYILMVLKGIGAQKG